MGTICWGTRGKCPPLFQTEGTKYAMPPHFLLFRFCMWRAFKNKSDVCDVLCDEFFMLDGRPHIAMLMLKQSLVWYHWFCSFISFSFDKIIFSIFQVSIDRERCLTASVRHFTLCGILLERLFSCNSESITAASVVAYAHNFHRGFHSVAYGGHLCLVCAVCDVTVWRHIHVSKPTFWRSLLTEYAYFSASTPLISCVIALNINYQRSKLGYRRKIHSTLRHSSSLLQKYQAAR